MRDGKINNNKLKVCKINYFIVFLMALIFSLTIGYRTLFNYEVKENVTIDQFIENRNINEEVIMPERGTIYDINGNPLAQDVASYTLIAYLSETREHVVDKEATAKALSEKIDTSYERILEILNKDAYQVEFGNGGKNLSQLEMEAIKDLNLPGIDFIKSTKRYYPNGDFASYLLGYTKNKEDDEGNIWITGELGIESYYNQELTGKSGYKKYEKDAKGNKIVNSNEYIEDAVDGADVYLTIDKNIQLFIEKETKKIANDSKSEWVVMGIMDAETGAILGYSSMPSFDPNIRNLTNYMDPLTSFTYEPGSTMKIFSYMCAMENGKYVGTATFKSGSKTYVSARDEKDTVTIKDWNGTGWGTITYDKGFAMSSNIGVATLLDEVMTKKQLSACLKKYGFGQVTGISLSAELKGNISFTYDVEAATAGYGQGITVTPLQLLQGLTIVANDGVMLRPYVVDKIVDGNGETILENKKEEVGKVVSKETVEKMETLLRSVICADGKNCTGYAYYMDDYDLIGKTGTASLYDYKLGRYLDWGSNYIYSFAGLYPGNDPKIIIYVAMKKPKDTYNYMAASVKDIVKNVSKYMNINESNNKEDTYLVNDYKNKNTTEAIKELTGKGLKIITLGTGNKVINQYPGENNYLAKGDMVVLLTNNYKKEMIDFTGMSYKYAKEILELMGVDYELKGNGYVSEQNVTSGKVISEKVILSFKGKY